MNNNDGNVYLTAENSTLLERALLEWAQDRWNIGERKWFDPGDVPSLQRIVTTPTGLIRYEATIDEGDALNISQEYTASLRKGKLPAEFIKVYHGPKMPMSLRSQSIEVAEAKAHSIVTLMAEGEGYINEIAVTPVYHTAKGDPLVEALYAFIRHPMDEPEQFSDMSSMITAEPFFRVRDDAAGLSGSTTLVEKIPYERQTIERFYASLQKMIARTR